MTPTAKIEQIRQAIKCPESLKESSTESFRIVIITLKQKETALEKELVPQNK